MAAIEAMRRRDARVFIGLGGNFAAASPDTQVTETALRSQDLTVHISTTLNRSHVVPGRTGLILPVLGRTEIDHQAAGPHFVTVEDSMSCVHASRGRLAPVSSHLISEVAFVSRLGRAVLGDTLPWRDFEADYRAVRERIANVVPGFEDYERRLKGNGFTLPNPPRDGRTFETADGKARFSVNSVSAPTVPTGRLLLQSLRSHDQYNTTVYGLDDRYRGIRGGRRVVFCHPDDVVELGFADGDIVDPGERVGRRRRTTRGGVPHRLLPIARGCAATYFPEANPLVALHATAKRSNTPVSKSIVIRLESRA